MDELVALRIVKSGRIEQGEIGLSLLGRESRPKGIVRQICSEAFESHGRVQLRPSFPSLVQLDLCDVPEQLRDVATGNCSRTGELRIGAERAHETAPGEFSSGEGA